MTEGCMAESTESYANDLKGVMPTSVTPWKENNISAFVQDQVWQSTTGLCLENNVTQMI